MTSEKYKWILSSIVIVVLAIGWFGMFWTMNLSNINVNWDIGVDDNARDYLLTHDYCLIQKDYNDGTSIMFMGDCQYFRESMLNITEGDKDGK